MRAGTVLLWSGTTWGFHYYHYCEGLCHHHPGIFINNFPTISRNKEECFGESFNINTKLDSDHKKAFKKIIKININKELLFLNNLALEVGWVKNPIILWSVWRVITSQRQCVMMSLDNICPRLHILYLQQNLTTVKARTMNIIIYTLYLQWYS